MPRQLKLYIIGVVTAGAVALGVTTLVIPVNPGIGIGFETLGTASTFAGLLFWTLVTLVASALPVRMPRGTMVGVSIAPLIAVLFYVFKIFCGFEYAFEKLMPFTARTPVSP